VADINIINVLNIEDNDEHFAEVARSLRRFSGRYNLVRGATFAEGLELIKTNNFDVLLLDLSLPDSSPEETLNWIQENGTELPIIVMTTHSEEQVGEHALKMFAQDFFPKQELSAGGLDRSIRYSRERHFQATHLRELNSILERSNSDLEQFVFLFRGEILDSLEALRTFCNLVSQESNNNIDGIDGLKGALNRSKSSLGHLEDITNSLLTFARLSMVSVQDEICDMNELFNDTVSEMQRESRYRDRLVVGKVDTMPTLKGRASYIKRILRTLVGLFLGLDEDNVKIYLHCDEVTKNSLTIRLRANVTPLFECQGRQTFLVFRRLFSYSTALTLCIAQQLVEREGGDIWVESYPDKGFSVLVKLKRDVASTKALDVVPVPVTLQR
jgi:DNA-binding NarL/FixJ family response regulator